MQKVLVLVLACVVALGISVAYHRAIFRPKAYPGMDRREWDNAVSFLDEQAMSNPDKAKREEAHLMSKLAKAGHQIGYEEGVRTCP